jgi:hypothetical protein
MLREDGAALGLKKSFSILDSDDAAAIVAQLVGTTDRKVARGVQGQIGVPYQVQAQELPVLFVVPLPCKLDEASTIEGVVVSVNPSQVRIRVLEPVSFPDGLEGPVGFMFGRCKNVGDLGRQSKSLLPALSNYQLSTVHVSSYVR